jgi:hypothetical protein
MTRVLNLHVQPVQRLPHVAWRGCSPSPAAWASWVPGTDCPRRMRGGEKVRDHSPRLSVRGEHNEMGGRHCACKWLQAPAKRGAEVNEGGSSAADRGDCYGCGALQMPPFGNTFILLLAAFEESVPPGLSCI